MSIIIAPITEYCTQYQRIVAPQKGKLWPTASQALSVFKKFPHISSNNYFKNT
jgi:hypothetical protein